MTGTFKRCICLAIIVLAVGASAAALVDVQREERSLQMDQVQSKASFISAAGRKEEKPVGVSADDLSALLRIPAADLLAANNMAADAFKNHDGTIIVPDACDIAIHSVVTTPNKMHYVLSALEMVRTHYISGKPQNIYKGHNRAQAKKEADLLYDVQIAAALKKVNRFSIMFDTKAYKKYEQLVADKLAFFEDKRKQYNDNDFEIEMKARAQVCTTNALWVYKMFFGGAMDGFQQDKIAPSLLGMGALQFKSIDDIFKELKANDGHNVAVIDAMGGEHYFVIQSRKINDVFEYRQLQSWVGLYTLAEFLDIEHSLDDDVQTVVDFAGKGQWLPALYETQMKTFFNGLPPKKANRHVLRNIFTTFFGPAADLAQAHQKSKENIATLAAAVTPWSPAACKTNLNTLDQAVKDYLATL